MKNVRIFIIAIFFLHNTYGKEGKFVIVPLPFYSDKTSFALSLKLLSTNIFETAYIDSISYATMKGQSGTFNTIGQKRIPLIPFMYWSILLGGGNSKSYFYGTGNHTDKNFEATYIKQSHIVIPRIGINILGFFKLYGMYIYSNSRYKDFIDLNDVHTSVWETTEKNNSINAIGYGAKFELYDDYLRPKIGIKMSYEFNFASPDIMKTNYSYRMTKLNIRIYLPLPFEITHASGFNLTYRSSSSPKFEYPTLMIRGISNTIHRDTYSYAFLNEERILISKNWMIVPFWDLGKVQNHNEITLTEDLHFGYGLGIRYIINEALVARLDLGFSKNNESSITFNYGHTF